MKTEKFEVTGMTCTACVPHIEKAVNKLNGIENVNVNLLTNNMTVSYDNDKQDINSIVASVEKAGYKAHILNVPQSSSTTTKINYVKLEQDEMKMRWWVSVSFLLPLLYITMGHMFGLPLPHFFHGSENALSFSFSQFLLTLPIVIINKKYFVNGFRTLFKAAPNMDSLIALGSSAAIIYGIYAIYRIGFSLGHSDMVTVVQFSYDLYFESGATILTLITLGKYLEAKSKSRTSESVTKLLDLAPKTATVFRMNQELEIPIEQVVVGDTIIVKPGQRIPVDGFVESGKSSVDESAITGESLPVFKQKGDSVLSASINKSGFFKFTATKIGKDTTLSQIIQLVEEAAASKAPISKLADKISSIFVPIVITLAITATVTWLLMGYPFDFALSIGIAVLVISCPCALGLATPVAIMVGIGKGAEHGILIKSSELLEMAYKIDTVVLDKTGTITQGKPKVTDIITSKSVSNNELLALAASLEKNSEHPLAEAIIIEAEKLKLKNQMVNNFQSIEGQGIEGFIKDEKYFAGNKKLMVDRNINLSEFEDVSDKLAEQGKTPLYIASKIELLGIIAVSDVLKPTSKEAIDHLKAMGIDVIMLTGDHAKTAEAIQLQLGISHSVAEVLPQDKEKEIVKLQKAGKTVAMVGDGINDAPALMRSNLGIAIGAGTDIAIESADVVLMHSNLLDVVNTLRLSKAVMINIKQNLFWAFFYNIIGIPLAAGLFYGILGWKLNPMFAAATMSFSSVSVVLNALRLLQFKPIISKLNTEPTIIQNKQITPILRSYQYNAQNSKHKVQNFENIKQTFQTNIIMTEKTMTIKGMSCGHCSARVEKVLNAIEGVEAKVDLANNSAKLLLTKDISNDFLSKSIDDIGYEVTGIV
jgi:Cu+-exporting ATPase